MKHKLLAAALGIGLFCTQSLQPMHIDRVIVSSDANEKYLQFWPIVAKTWQQVTGIRPTLALVADESVQVDETLGDVVRFLPIQGVPTALQAQTIRLLLPAYMYPDDVCLVSDIDMIPLSKGYYQNSVKNIADDHFVVYRNGVFDEDEQGWLMCYVAARGKTYGDVFNVRTAQQAREKIQAWYDLRLEWFTDQLVMRKELMEWSEYQTRCTKLGHKESSRLSRDNWEYTPWAITHGHFIDAHLLRPYNQYKEHIDLLISYLPTNYSPLKKPPVKAIRQLSNQNLETHLSPLITAVMGTTGSVLAMGSDDLSTPVLHAICAAQKRFLLTADTDHKRLSRFTGLSSDNHRLLYIPMDDKTQIGNDRRWGVVFIDHCSDIERHIYIARMKSKADIIVLRDSCKPTYTYEPLFTLFKYRCTFKFDSTYTTLLSDTIDVADLFLK